jgi:hypothetical protein
MSLAAETRAAVRAHPFLYEALRAGVVNYTAAARFLDLGDEEAVAVALRRFADDLPVYAPPEGGARVDMKSGLGADSDDPLFSVGDVALGPGGGDLTGILATGTVDAGDLGPVLGRLAANDIAVTAAGAAEGHLLVAVSRRDGVDALRVVERAVGR